MKPVAMGKPGLDAIPAGAGQSRSEGRPAAVADSAPPLPPDRIDLAGFFDRKLPLLAPPPTPAQSCQAVWQDALYAPLREFLARPSKGLRARLAFHGWTLAGGRGPAPEDLYLLPEILHSASLIVDDIQDGALSRRGAPALHRLIGVEQALNAANWLYFWPYALVPELALPDDLQRRCAALITTTLLDCHRGQSLDLAVQVWALAPAEVQAVVSEQSRLKTGRLTALCTGLGAIAAGGGAAQTALLQQFGEQVGVALQMLDDLTAVLLPARHDKAGEDLCRGRPTWAWALAARYCTAARYEVLTQQAQAAAQGGDWQPVCRTLADCLADGGLRPAQDVIAAAGHLLVQHFPGAPALDAVLNDLAGLERAYG